MLTEHIEGLKKYLKTDEYDLSNFYINEVISNKFYLCVCFENITDENLTANIEIDKKFNSLHDMYENNNNYSLNFNNRRIYLYKKIDNKSFVDEYLHCANGPAFIKYKDGLVEEKKYYLEGLNKSHLGLPDEQIIFSTKIQEWKSNNVLHKIDGPAYVCYKAKQKTFDQYYLGGILLSKESYKNIVNKIINNELDYEQILIDKGMHIKNYYNIDILLKLEFLLDIAQYYNLINISDKLMSIMVLNNLNGDNNV